MNKSIEVFDRDSTKFFPSFVTPFIEYVCIGAPDSGYKYSDMTLFGVSSVKRSIELSLTKCTEIVSELFFIFKMLIIKRFANIGHNGGGVDVVQN